MTLRQIRTQIQTRQRKYAKELLIYRLRRQADQVYNHWAPAVGDRQEPPQPQPHSIIRKFAAAGFFLPTYNSLHRYLEDLRQEGSIPESRQIVLALLPWARTEKYEKLLCSDLPAEA